ncbi:DUF6447 family protein [Marinobacter sp. ANT_B65]|uniref:DUF6447 family protein n=1 Tax=Marinobacter sp. ANT_B65 TaxID=2039467 RepID=UPI001930E5EF|nr:DUF6447 family protein [Marinobacter sp. ANT_B65]
MTDTKKTGTASKPAGKAPAKPAARKASAPKPAAGAAPKKTTRKTASNKASKEMITIDGKSYPVDALNENAKAQITNLRASDKIIAELETELAITKTARQRYGEALEHELKQLNTTLQ